VSDNLLDGPTPPAGDPRTPAEARDRYRAYLAARLRSPRPFVAEAIAARARRLQEPARAVRARR
jgi:hypothetical protein